jgi:hypothetical protein
MRSRVARRVVEQRFVEPALRQPQQQHARQSQQQYRVALCGGGERVGSKVLAHAGRSWRGAVWATRLHRQSQEAT